MSTDIHMFKHPLPQDILIFGSTFRLNAHMLGPTCLQDFRGVTFGTFSVSVELIRISYLKSQFSRQINRLPLTVHLRQVPRFTGQI